MAKNNNKKNVNQTNAVGIAERKAEWKFIESVRDTLIGKPTNGAKDEGQVKFYRKNTSDWQKTRDKWNMLSIFTGFIGSGYALSPIIGGAAPAIGLVAAPFAILGIAAIIAKKIVDKKREKTYKAEEPKLERAQAMANYAQKEFKPDIKVKFDINYAEMIHSANKAHEILHKNHETLEKYSFFKPSSTDGLEERKLQLAEMKQNIEDFTALKFPNGLPPQIPVMPPEKRSFGKKLSQLISN